MPVTAWSDATAASLEWFRQARFGLFIHWGLYAVPAGVWQGRQVPYIGEWIQHGECIPAATYAALARGFSGDDFDAMAWAACARRAGMRYLVLTAKHHEGFALWPSASDPFNVNASACNRDIVGELAQACRATGIRLGLYYSHCVDWHEAHAGNLPDDQKGIEGGRPRLWGNDWDFPCGTPAGFDAYLRRKVEPQLHELLTSYGDIALIWFDTPTNGLQPEQARRIRYLIKQHQPGCLVGGRIGHGFQDFDCLGDNQVPREALLRPGESCMTLNDTWGYKEHDHSWAAPDEVIRLLAECTAKDCNLLLNVGPTSAGLFPAPAIERLATVGRWMDAHGESIHGCGSAGLPYTPPWGEVTRSGDTLHLLVSDASATSVSLPHPHCDLSSVQDGTGRDLDVQRVDGASGSWLIVSLPPTSESLIRHVRIICTAPPHFEQTVSEDPSGILTLPSHAARDERGQAWSGYGDAGRTVTWTIRCAAPGRFRVTVVCGGDRYGFWYGGHTVEFRSGGASLRGTLVREQDEPGRSWQHWPAASTTLGELFLEAGSQDLTYAFIATAEPSAAYLPMVRLQRIE